MCRYVLNIMIFQESTSGFYNSVNVLGVPRAFREQRRGAALLPRLSLRPRAASALWPTGPGPGGIPLRRDLQSRLTRGSGNLFSQVIFLRQPESLDNPSGLLIVLLSTVNRQLSNSLSRCPRNQSFFLAKQLTWGLPTRGCGCKQPACIEIAYSIRRLVVPQGETSPTKYFSYLSFHLTIHFISKSYNPPCIQREYIYFFFPPF